MNRFDERPSSRELARMEQALDWLRHLRDRDPSLTLVIAMWALTSARRKSFRALCKQRSWNRSTADKKVKQASKLVADRLSLQLAPVF